MLEFQVNQHLNSFSNLQLISSIWLQIGVKPLPQSMMHSIYDAKWYDYAIIIEVISVNSITADKFEMIWYKV